MSGETKRESDDHQLGRIRVYLRRGSARYVSAPDTARASYQRGLQGSRKIGYGPDRDDGRLSTRSVDRVGEELSRSAEHRSHRARSDFILLDRTLALYGPETKDARSQIPATINSVVDQTWSKDAFRSENVDRAFGPRAEMFYAQIRQLEPRTDFQRAVYAQLLDIGMELRRKRSFLLEQTGGSIPTPLLVVLAFWLALIFAGFGLSARTNSTVIGTLVACALSVAAALFLILELDRPFRGLLQISGASLRDALVHLGK
jgi:hypothetical protein